MLDHQLRILVGVDVGAVLGQKALQRFTAGRICGRLAGREPTQGGDLLVTPDPLPFSDEVSEHLPDGRVVWGERGPRRAGWKCRWVEHTSLVGDHRGPVSTPSTRSTRGSLIVSTVIRLPCSAIDARRMDSPLANW